MISYTQIQVLRNKLMAEKKSAEHALKFIKKEKLAEAGSWNYNKGRLVVLNYAISEIDDLLRKNMGEDV